ncbi:hypothetical protein ASD21_22185 [Caulobacter sp. Root1455]|uniref:lytic transglycosylase domain-containing protein n=1 Tax=unclassified Caulobacter TaxID=2648921 RepID=UPI0006F775B5|nr:MULTISPECIES: lytic transglycosylase domain-containing protein [unclassified Caulobacter]KQY32997.1 hypothetical protein ASD38_22230 [Caulobacter sp. Root487D2Y]KQZ02669.1 hypothetical protein ASD21_22185 [Caulobacter sp. Root1455]
MVDLAALFELAQRCAPTIAPMTMVSIVQVESRGNPLAINVNRAPDPPPAGSREQAIATAERLIAQGQNLDLGLAQINSRNLAPLGLTVADAFEPCKNLAASATLLQANYVAAARLAPAQQALRMAFSAYNTGNHRRGFLNGYVAKVEAEAIKLSPGAISGASGIKPALPPALQAAVEAAAENIGGGEQTASKPSLDVFARGASRTIVVFGGGGQ